MRLLKITIKRIFIVSLLFTLVFATIIIYFNKLSNERPEATKKVTLQFNNKKHVNMMTNLFQNSELRTKLLRQKVERLTRKIKMSRNIITNSKPMLNPNYNVHIFYYAWYKNPAYDGEYQHWNHQYLPNWRKDDPQTYPNGFHWPPGDIGSNYYPLLGCYSSNDPEIIKKHVQDIRDAGIGVIVISWAPPGYKDSPSAMLPKLLDFAKQFSVKVALHVEPYKDRNPVQLRAHLSDFFKQFGNHSALYKIKKPLTDKLVPVIYVYDSYLVSDDAWRELLGKKGKITVRDTELDAVYLGLIVEMKHRYHIKKSQFDGFYTYFASNGFTYGSTWKNWRGLSRFALQNGLVFAPSVGPGYIDVQVRPWNSVNTRHRRQGQYYDVAWRTALNNNVNYVSITSFNEWHEGTQIEPAVPKSGGNNQYLDYEPNGPYFYLNLTRAWIEEFQKNAG